MGGGDTPATLIVSPTLGRRHHHVAQCCRNIQPSFRKCLGIQKVCLGFKRGRRNVDNKSFFKSKNTEKNKIMIWGIHYSITKLKTIIVVIPKSCFNFCVAHLSVQRDIKTKFPYFSCLNHMVILSRQNKNTDCLLIPAWSCRFIISRQFLSTVVGMGSKSHDFDYDLSKTFILDLISFFLNRTVTFGIIDQTLPNLQGSYKYSCRCCLKNNK